MLFINLFNKKCSGETIKNQNKTRISRRIRQPVIRKSKKKKAHSLSVDNTWGANLGDIQLISKLNKGFRFSLCVIDIYSKYTWVISLKDKSVITITNTFRKVLNKFSRKPNKALVDKDT